jgi:uncharacterized glyoxalase superfamily protein PhnB
MTIKAIPEGYRTLTPYLTVADAAAEIDFLKRAFNATVRYQHARPDGTVGHAEVEIGDSRLMLGGATDQYSPRPGTIYMYVEDIDTTYRQAMSAGATSLREPTNEFYGDRSGGVLDPQGNQWWIATHVEDVSPEELERRARAAGR